MKLADLKRIPAGTKLRLIHSLLGPASKLRIVQRVQSNAVTFSGDGIAEGKESWLYFPKASDFEATANGFRIYETDTERKTRELAAEYIFACECKPGECPDTTAGEASKNE